MPLPGPQGERLKIRITAPPIEGKANAHLLKFLARRFRVNKSQVRLLAGATSRDKRVCIESPARLLAGVEPPTQPAKSEQRNKKQD